MKRKNMLSSLAVAGAILAFVVWFPLPFSVKCAI